MIRFDPEWTLPSRMHSNPLIWIVELDNGMPVDVRHLPREIQIQAFEQGLIPFPVEPLDEGLLPPGAENDN